MNIHRMKTKLKVRKNEASLISSVSNILYLTSFSHFSNQEREAYLFTTDEKQYIITDGRYSEAVKNLLGNFEVIERSSKLSLERILKQLIKQHQVKKLAIEEEDLRVSEFKLISEFVNITKLDSHNLRSIKNQAEIISIEKACQLGDDAFLYILKKIKKGLSEKQLAYELESFIRKNGADISFTPIVAFGKNSSMSHHKSGNEKLGETKIVLLDFGVKIDNYCSDMTRTVFFGKITKKQEQIYKIVYAAQKKAIAYINSKKNPRASDVDKVVREFIIQKGFPSIPHSVGHGIGIDVHEPPHLSPKSKDILEPGMVFSIEPGIYSPNFGGVRIEDLFVLQKNGLRQLTNSPKYLIEI